MNEPPDGFKPEDFETQMTNNIGKIAKQLAALIAAQREQLLGVALIEVEGKMPTFDEMAKHGHINRMEGQPGEMVMWKGKPLIYFGNVGKLEDGTPSLEFKFMYTVEEPPE